VVDRGRERSQANTSGRFESCDASSGLRQQPGEVSVNDADLIGLEMKGFLDRHSCPGIRLPR
jgi:hypothetical protein